VLPLVEALLQPRLLRLRLPDRDLGANVMVTIFGDFYEFPA
jgi:hypothetical protein